MSVEKRGAPRDLSNYLPGDVGRRCGNRICVSQALRGLPSKGRVAARLPSNSMGFGRQRGICGNRAT
jgi:ArsR family metal-binding transcriptional regulator